jgi:hypothetical protein
MQLWKIHTEESHKCGIININAAARLGHIIFDNE